MAPGLPPGPTLESAESLMCRTSSASSQTPLLASKALICPPTLGETRKPTELLKAVPQPPAMTGGEAGATL